MRPQMGFVELINKTLFEGYSSMDIQVSAVLTCLLFTAIISLYVFGAYKVMHRNTFYNFNFNLSLLMLSLITAAIILTIQSSVVVSLGMVGALSIVRFRTAIKDPMDLAYLFWSISIGIICGAGLAIIAIIMSLGATVIMVVFEKLYVPSTMTVLVVNAKRNVEDEVMEILKDRTRYSHTRARNFAHESVNMAIELRTNVPEEIVEEVMKLDGVVTASLVDQGEQV